jgi:hypothetical protein
MRKAVRQLAILKSTLLDALRSRATCRNAGPHSGEGKIHGKDVLSAGVRPVGLPNNVVHL